MTRKIQAEIKQVKPFESRQQEAFVSLLRTSDALAGDFEEILKPVGLTGTQYNALRILRGAGKDGRSCHEVGERMLTRDPDVTRLLDRLKARGLITRTRGRRDRRVIKTRITEAGLELLGRLDEAVEQFHRRRLAHLGKQDLDRLIRLLARARESSG